MQEGMILGRPPVNIGLVAARHNFRSLMRGAGSYGAAAGGGAPLAMPQLQGGLLRPPAGPQRAVDMVDLYPLSPALFKMDLRRRFGH